MKWSRTLVIILNVCVVGALLYPLIFNDGVSDSVGLFVMTGAFFLGVYNIYMAIVRGLYEKFVKKDTPIRMTLYVVLQLLPIGLLYWYTRY